MIYEPIPYKQCRKCKQWIEADTCHFTRKSNQKDGLYYYCRPCKSDDESRWKKKNPEKYRAIKRRQYAKNPYTHQRRIRRYEQRHAQEIRERHTKYRRSERGKLAHRIIEHNRRSRKRNATGRYTSKQVLDQLKRQHGKCYYCHKSVGQKWHIDHVIPLIRGGTNDISNIVIACEYCNLRKNKKLPHEWPEGGRLL